MIRWCSHIPHVPTLARFTGVAAFQQSLIIISCPLTPQVCSQVCFSSGCPGPSKPDGDLVDLSAISVCYAMRFWAGVIVVLWVLLPYCSFFQDSTPCLLCLGSCSWYIGICPHGAIQTPPCVCVCVCSCSNYILKILLYLWKEDILTGPYNFKAPSEG